MNKITAAIILGFIILALAGSCILLRRESLINSFQELKGTVSEARIVKDDLNNMLEKSLDISREIVNNIDSRMAETNINIKEQIREETALSVTPSPQDDTGRRKKIRIYELARALDINSRDLIDGLQAIGYAYNSPLNTVEQSTALKIKEQLGGRTEAQADIILEQNDKNEVIMKSEVSDEVEPGIINPLSIDDSQEMEAWIESLREAHPYLAVKTLADKGYSIRAIAKLLNRGQGEVSLILNLLNKKRAYM